MAGYGGKADITGAFLGMGLTGGSRPRADIAVTSYNLVFSSQVFHFVVRRIANSRLWKSVVRRAAIG